MSAIYMRENEGCAEGRIAGERGQGREYASDIDVSKDK
jgi:hypothetical protein